MEIKAICELMNFMAENMNLILIINLFFKVFEAEAALGSKRFEYIENEDCEILMYDMTSFLKLVATEN